jgi:hypothetical protein
MASTEEKQKIHRMLSEVRTFGACLAKVLDVVILTIVCGVFATWIRYSLLLFLSKLSCELLFLLSVPVR